ncbi:hypothetical protein [Methanoculleus chikugoensis]|uniref:hypothetical protein n=1 Tax=Methanoculleus chikugoensis TaxID=118126 RepID=UPI000B3145A0|nr:hypothetical protein [Methanoculleus chikugoensis]
MAREPEPQWIVPLSGGHWFVETMDSTRVEMGGPGGELSFGNDQNTRPDEEGGRRGGHRSGTVGDEDAVLMLVQVKRSPVPR